jgi:ADP-ribose pyrophosphatase YjhB (NUDIX family)
VYNSFTRADLAARPSDAMNRIKAFLSRFWKMLPRPWRWRLLWLVSDHFLVGVTGVVLNARDELLLAHHVYRKGIVWGLPGGGVKHGESLEHAMQREILEETGLAAHVHCLVQVNLDVRRPLLNAYFLCQVEGTPQPQTNRELFEAGFFPLDAHPGPIDPYQWSVVQRALEIRSQPELALSVSTGLDQNEDQL